jgi:hypothetical protein
VTERETEHDFNSKTPIMIPGALMQHAMGDDASDQTKRFLARMPTLGWLALLYAATYLLAQRWFAAGPLALGLLALDPNLIAHGALATVDVPFAVATLLLIEAIRRVTERGTLGNGALLGAALALALTAKFSALVIIVPALIVPLARWRRPPFAAFAVAVLVAWLLICATYGFHGMGQLRGAWESGPFMTLRRTPFVALFPHDFLSGIDKVIADDLGDGVTVAMNGQLYQHGVPSYFVYHAALKTPLALLAAALFGMVLGGPERRQALSVAVVVALTGIYFSFYFETQLGYRYVLMLLPLVYILAARGWTATLGARSGVFLAVVALLSYVETARYVEHPLAFTNTIVYDKTQAFQYVADSNLDWGQDSEAVDKWVVENHATHDPYNLTPGLNLFGASLVAGIWNPERYAYLRSGYRKPDQAPFYSQVAWDVGREEFESYMDKYRNLGGTERMTRPCQIEGRPLRRVPKSDEDSYICVDSPQGGDLVFDAHGDTTLATWNGSCASAEPVIFKGQSAWFRVAAGQHLLCVKGGPVAFRFQHGHGQIGAAAPQ